MAAHKGEFTEEEKQDIIRLYLEEKRGKKYIGSLYNRSDFSINYWLKKWNIPIHSRSTIQKTIRCIHGPTQGFTGRKHKEESKLKSSESGKKSYLKSDRKSNYAKSKTFDTILGKVLGTYEVAYLQKLLDENKELPLICHKRYNTPFGSYKPDFEFEDRFIEIKSQFTLDLANGKYPELKTEDNKKQLDKINYISKTLKRVEVIVISKEDALQYFSKAEEEKGILR